MPHVAVGLAGCGRLDGSEIHESTLALLYLAQAGATYQCFAPDLPQVKVMDHLHNKPLREERNQLIEAARIARGNIKPISEADPKDFHALVIPGGSGAGENLSQGPGAVDPNLRRLILGFFNAAKPIAAICIAPTIVARVLGDQGVRLTIGNDPRFAEMITKCGAEHVECTVDRCFADEAHQIVSTPAYMLGPGLADIAPGIQACINKLISWCLQV